MKTIIDETKTTIVESGSQYGATKIASIYAPTREACEKAVEEYLDRYHPAGYGTKVTVKPFAMASHQMWSARLERLNSCD